MPITSICCPAHTKVAAKKAASCGTRMIVQHSNVGTATAPAVTVLPARSPGAASREPVRTGNECRKTSKSHSRIVHGNRSGDRHLACSGARGGKAGLQARHFKHPG